MSHMTLFRLEESPHHTAGILKVDSELLCYTLELPWRDNTKNVSCIPTGQYEYKLSETLSHGLCVRVLDVPNRTGILIHIGNFIQEIEGCILVGIGIAETEEAPPHRMLTESRIALNKVLAKLTPTGTILITEACLFELEDQDD